MTTMDIKPAHVSEYICCVVEYIATCLSFNECNMSWFDLMKNALCLFTLIYRTEVFWILLRSYFLLKICFVVFSKALYFQIFCRFAACSYSNLTHKNVIVLCWLFFSIQCMFYNFSLHKKAYEPRLKKPHWKIWKVEKYRRPRFWNFLFVPPQNLAQAHVW